MLQSGKKQRLVKCKADGCVNTFSRQVGSFQSWCSTGCAIKIARTRQAATKRKEMARRKARLKTRSQWIVVAQRAFNGFIRVRDAALPCISCGLYTEDRFGGGWDCGHYRSAGANPELRFEELNAHKQCKRCNSSTRGLSGNVVNYRIGLLKKIGQENLAWLEGPHEPKKYTITDLIEIKKRYSKLTREICNKG